MRCRAHPAAAGNLRDQHLLKTQIYGLLERMGGLTDLLQIVRSAESACAEVVMRPEDTLARQTLLACLASLAAATLDPPLDSLREAQVFAAIVRTRITALSPHRQSIVALEAIRHPAQNLLEILSHLAADLERVQGAQCS